MSYADVEMKVVRWGEDRQIVQNSNPRAQAIKTLEEVGELMQAITVGSKGVWLQLDVIDENAVKRASDAGLIAVMNRCPAIEYAKRV